MTKLKELFLNKKFLIFCLIGLGAYLTHQASYSLYIALSHKEITYDDNNHLIANTIGFVIGSLVSYILNVKFTYKEKYTKENAFLSFLTYVVKYLISLGITYACMTVLKKTLENNTTAYQVLENLIPIVVTGVTLIFQYFCFNKIFKKKEEEK